MPFWYLCQEFSNSGKLSSMLQISLLGKTLQGFRDPLLLCLILKATLFYILKLFQEFVEL